MIITNMPRSLSCNTSLNVKIQLIKNTAHTKAKMSYRFHLTQVARTTIDDTSMNTMLLCIDHHLGTSSVSPKLCTGYNTQPFV